MEIAVGQHRALRGDDKRAVGGTVELELDLRARLVCEPVRCAMHLRNDPERAAPQPAVAMAEPVAGPVPAQLPHDVPGFTGRAAEIAELDRFLDETSNSVLISAIDGAGGWGQFRHITIPALRPIIIFTIVTSTIGGLQIFAEPLLVARMTNLTCGAVRQCQTLALFLYEQGFGQYQFGYGSAVGVALFAMIILIAAVNYLLSSRIRGEGR